METTQNTDSYRVQLLKLAHKMSRLDAKLAIWRTLPPQHQNLGDIRKDITAVKNHGNDECVALAIDTWLALATRIRRTTRTKFQDILDVRMDALLNAIPTIVEPEEEEEADIWAPVFGPMEAELRAKLSRQYGDIREAFLASGCEHTRAFALKDTPILAAILKEHGLPKHYTTPSTVPAAERGAYRRELTYYRGYVSEHPIHQVGFEVKRDGFKSDSIYFAWLTEYQDELVAANRVKFDRMIASRFQKGCRGTVSSITKASARQGAQGFEGSAVVVTTDNNPENGYGSNWFFSCKAILAGGYNIQCLHYRFIGKAVEVEAEVEAEAPSAPVEPTEADTPREVQEEEEAAPSAPVEPTEIEALLPEPTEDDTAALKAKMIEEAKQGIRADLAQIGYQTGDAITPSPRNWEDAVVRLIEGLEKLDRLRARN